MFKLVRLPYIKNVRFETTLSKAEIDKRLNELNFDYSKNPHLLDNPEFTSYFKTEYGFKVEHSHRVKNGYVYVDAFADIISDDNKTVLQIEYVATVDTMKYIFYFLYFIVLIGLSVIIPIMVKVLPQGDYGILAPFLILVFFSTIPQWFPSVFLSGPASSLNSKIYWKLKK